MKKQVVSIFLVICMLVCLVPSGLFVSAAADFTMPEGPLFLADGGLHYFGSGSSDSIVWSCVGDSILLSDSGHAIGMGSGLSVVTAVEADGTGHACPVYVSDTIETYAFADVAASMYKNKAVDLTKINAYEDSQAEGVSSSEWMYADGNSEATYDPETGLVFFESADNEELLQFKVKVAKDGNYVAFLPYTPSAVTDVFLAPADAADAVAAEYKVFTTVAGDETAAAQTLQSERVLCLSAGEYLLTFAQVSGTSLTLDAFELFRVSDLCDVAENISLTCDSTIILQGNSAKTDVAILPEALADAGLVYYSENPIAATIDQEGNVSALGAGTVSLCVASKYNPFVSDSVRISVAALTDDYQFAALAEKLATDYPGVADLKGDATVSALLKDDCSALVSSSAPFTFIDMGSACSYDAGAPADGITFSLSDTEAALFKIEITKSGRFLPAVTATASANAASVAFSIAPLTDEANAAASKYRVLEVAASDAAEGTETFTLSDSVVNLPKGEYLLAISKTNDGANFTLKNFGLYKVDEYLAPSGVTIASDNIRFCSAGETFALSAAALPETPYVDVTWSSSNSAVASVNANGTVTALKEGAATIIATTADGTNIANSITVMVDAKAAHSFELQDYANEKGKEAMKTATAEATANFGGWVTKEYDGSPSLGSDTSLILGKLYAFTFIASESGPFTAQVVCDLWSSSCDAEVFIAPSSVAKDAALTDAYKVINIPWYTGENTVDAVFTADGTFTLKAGEEYTVWLRANPSYKSTPITSDDPNYVQGSELCYFSYENYDDGKTYVSPPRTVKNNSGYNFDRYFLMDALHLYRVVSEPVSISISGTPDKMDKYETATLTAAVSPATETQTVTWTSSDDKVATVDKDGVVTARGNGTATITATWTTIKSISKSVTITVDGVAAKYDFDAVGRHHYEGAPISFNENEAELLSYEIAKGTDQSDAWKHLARSGAYFAYDGENFSMNGTAGSTTDWVAFTIDSPDAGVFSGKLNYGVCATSSPAKIYIAPNGTDSATAMTDAYLAFEVSGTGSVAKTIKNIQLLAQEYDVYVVQNAADANDDTVILKNLTFTKVGEIPVESVSISGAPETMAKGQTVNLTATVLPAIASQSIIWTSSNDKIVSVKDGVITANKLGRATITATSAADPSISASVDVKILGKDGYNFDFWAVGKMLYDESGANVTLKWSDTMSYDNAEAAGSALWKHKVRSTNNPSFTHNGTDLYLNGKKGGTSIYGLTIKIDEAGTYTGKFNYDVWTSSSPAKIYIAPAGTSESVAQTDQYLYFELLGSNTDANGWVAESKKNLELQAGEYDLWVCQIAEEDNDRYVVLKNMELSKALEGNIATVDSAQMRTTGKQGLRFVSSIDKALIEENGVISYGTLLLPTADLTGDLVLGYVNSENGHSAAQVEAQKIYDETDTSLSFTAVLTDIQPKNYTRQISARAYAILANGDVVYSDVTTSRSIYQIAKGLVANENVSQEVKDAANAIISAVEG